MSSTDSADMLVAQAEIALGAARALRDAARSFKQVAGYPVQLHGHEHVRHGQQLEVKINNVEIQATGNMGSAYVTHVLHGMERLHTEAIEVLRQRVARAQGRLEGESHKLVQQVRAYTRPDA